MDTIDILKICLRRWYVMLPILLGAAGVGYQLTQDQVTTYTASTSYGLVQPDLPAGTLAERNPLGADGKTLVGAALEAQLSSRETQAKLGSDATRGWGPGEIPNRSSYSVKIPQYETTYEVRAWGEDEQAVRDVVERVIQAAPGIADRLQAQVGVPSAVRYRPFVLAPTQVDALPSTSRMKLVVAVMGIGGLMGAAWSIVADRLLRQVERRRAERRGNVDTEPEQPDPSKPSSAIEREAHQGAPADPETREKARAERRPVPDWARGSAPPGTDVGEPPRAGPPEARMARNGQRHSKTKVASPPPRGAEQRRRTGGR